MYEGLHTIKTREGKRFLKVAVIDKAVNREYNYT